MALVHPLRLKKKKPQWVQISIIQESQGLRRCVAAGGKMLPNESVD